MPPLSLDKIGFRVTIVILKKLKKGKIKNVSKKL